MVRANPPGVWSARVRDLQARGWTLREIGSHIGLATTAVGDIATGRTVTPSGDAAIKLHELHASCIRR